MPTYANIRMTPPKSWDEFEAIVCSAAKNRWNSPDFHLHGRKGQKQDGVDVWGMDNMRHMVGIQCKNTLSRLTTSTIDEEVEKAESFKPALERLYVATTADTDKHLQEYVRKLSCTRLKAGKFEVTILFWSDVWSDLTLKESRLFQHYPQLKPEPSAQRDPTHDQRLYEEFKVILGFDPAIRLLRDHDFGGSFQRKAIQPLFDFSETWDSPEKEFMDTELQIGLATLYEAANNLVNHLAEKTVPIGNGDFASVFSDQLRNQGPRPDWVIQEARLLNKQASQFVPIYERFMRQCREKLDR